MKDKELLQMLEVLGRNSRRSLSLAASEVVTKGDRDRVEDTRCAATLKKIITGNDNNLSINKSFAASAAPSTAAANPNPNVNRVKVLTDFIFRNRLR